MINTVEISHRKNVTFQIRDNKARSQSRLYLVNTPGNTCYIQAAQTKKEFDGTSFYSTILHTHFPFNSMSTLVIDYYKFEL